MAIELELDSRLKMNGKVYEEGTPAKKLPKEARAAAKAAGALRIQRVDEADLEAALAEMDAEDDEEETEAKPAAKAKS